MASKNGLMRTKGFLGTSGKCRRRADEYQGTGQQQVRSAAYGLCGAGGRHPLS